MSTVTLEQAQASLAELIHQLGPGQELVIIHGDRAVATLTASPAPIERPRRQLGTLRGTVTYIADDFDGPLDDFAEYME
jgi:antitoxin (DNA-binding transcriptional repressor) of toxin-antitoxin stability system